MKKIFSSLILFSLFCVEALASDLTDAIERVKNLELPNIEITSVELLKAGQTYTSQGKEEKVADDILLVRANAKSPSRVKIVVALPMLKNWNKRFLAFGNGGIGSAVLEKYSCNGAAAGFASAHSNLGTENWWDAPDFKVVIRDFGHDAAYKMAYTGKKCAEAFYAQAAKHSYYVGGSTGGQEGLSLAERHPEEFDGIFVMFPAADRTAVHLRFAWEHLISGDKKNFTKDEIKKISEEIIAQNRKNDGEYTADERPYLKYPERAKVDYSKLNFLSDEQIDILKKFHSELIDPKNGKKVSCRMLPSAEVEDGMISLSGGFNDWFVEWIYGKGATWNLVTDLHEYIKKMNTFAAECNVRPNFDAFKKRGGKLIIVQGKVDTIVPAELVKNFFKKLCSKNGGAEKTSAFARMYLLAGGAHGNMEINLLPALIDWVENGNPPENITINVHSNGAKYPEKAELFLP